MVGPPPESWSVDVERATASEVAPGIWRLRLPLAWPTIPHVNAYLLAADDGVALVDCGVAGDPSCGLALERALAITGHALGDVRVLIATHTHSDHVGLAQLVLERSGAEFWMHPASAHFYDATRAPDLVRAARERRARAEGVPAELLADFADTREETEGVQSAVEPDRTLGDGVSLPHALGGWAVVETPGHAPSHVSLVHAERGILIAGDILGPVFSPSFDYGYSPDPLGEYLGSLARLGRLDGIRIVLPGHGRPMPDLGSVIALHRDGIAERLASAERAVESGAAGAWEITARMFAERPSGMDGVAHMTVAMACLRHLRLHDRVIRVAAADGTFSYRPARPGPVALAERG
jgi:glyoxylase-like metal-dependent hydrolase (beta-lactamase superfamily II)